MHQKDTLTNDITPAYETQGDTLSPIEKPMPARPFGRDRQRMPIYGLGGQSLIQTSPTDDEPIALIQRAIDHGVRYIDTAPLYGLSELRIGKAIKGRRSEVFLASKTGYRRGSSARRSLERSLQRLETDYLDSMQLHCFMDSSEISASLGRFGVVKMLERAREEGIVRHIGITGHYDPALLSTLLKAYPFDSVLMPVNIADPSCLSFLHDTLIVAQETQTSVVAMKVMGAGMLTRGGFDPGRLLRFALSWPVSVAIVSCGSIMELDYNIHTAKEFHHMTNEEMADCESENPLLMEQCNNIYKRHKGKHGLKIALRNRIAAEGAKWLPGWWHL